MKLERLYVDIDNVAFDNRSYIDGHTLHVSKDELEKVVSSEAFSKVEISIAVPGTNTRIINIGDIVQPTIKLDDEGDTFPGVIGKMRTVGRGRSLMLRNIAVSEVVEMPVDIPSILDLSKVTVEAAYIAGYYHVTIDAFPAEGISRTVYLGSLHTASKKLARHLAGLAKACTPDETEEFTLERHNLEGLPKIAYLCDVFCHRPYTDALVYGETMGESLPIILHPNEIIDGAVLNRDYDNSTNADPTYVWQNHPIIFELYRRHGIDVNFVGVVLNNVHHTVESKLRNATMAASMVHNQLKAEGCIITKEGGGHPQIDVGLAADVLEGEYGIKTTLVLLGLSNETNAQVIFKSKYTDAIVSTGAAVVLSLPAADQVIGSSPDTRYGNPLGPMTIALRSMHGAQSQMGWTRYGAQRI
ncbi:glycine reductase complex component B subunits alpha and beta [Oxobacter pfennigii]|uniref:Glycine reductase complex component B subunits alpha and beta n=1 Tax=Oxobacter pfennigii TaxID=36849 RepID=A0A0P8W4T3_9CLOT|nr:glycine/sarcosine/betaine reductase component B subunit [Oxobacter pfennigii]KPU42819.1 glycine reductase complex component B subunits alpha and beta [Oxobacter pfennigii]